MRRFYTSANPDSGVNELYLEDLDSSHHLVMEDIEAKGGWEMSVIGPEPPTVEFTFVETKDSTPRTEHRSMPLYQFKYLDANSFEMAGHKYSDSSLQSLSVSFAPGTVNFKSRSAVPNFASNLSTQTVQQVPLDPPPQESGMSVMDVESGGRNVNQNKNSKPTNWESFFMGFCGCWSPCRGDACNANVEDRDSACTGYVAGQVFSGVVGFVVVLIFVLARL